MHSKSAKQQRQLWCFALSILGSGGVAATQHKLQYDRPPLPGSCRDTCSFRSTFAIAVSRWIPLQTAFPG